MGGKRKQPTPSDTMSGGPTNTVEPDIQMQFEFWKSDVPIS